MPRSRDVVVGLDLGTTKVCAVVGERTTEGINIIGLGMAPSHGIRAGVVVNIEKTVKAIYKALEEAKFMAGCDIDGVHVGVAGTHVQGLNSHGVIAIKDRGEVTETDIYRVMDAAQAVAMPADKIILHIIPQEFIVDDHKGIMDPLGMSGVRLEARVHLIIASGSAIRNIEKCCAQAGVYVESYSLEILASSRAILYPDELKLGVAVIDIGGGTTDIAVFQNGSIRYIGVLSLGGNHITADISVGLKTSLDEAERIKRKYGCALAEAMPQDEPIEVRSLDGRRSFFVDSYALGTIIEDRTDEILRLAWKRVLQSGYIDHLHAGVVLTGGVAMLPYIKELAEDIFEMPVRIGVPIGFGGLKDVIENPMFATAAGLLLPDMDELGEKLYGARPSSLAVMEWLRRAIAFVRRWFREI
ncbi:MAG: cell division protein FtsA [Syntrophobacterales bacterium]|nr:cell division protein FtsA [Syntrophobacterales bacterium]